MNLVKPELKNKKAVVFHYSDLLLVAPLLGDFLEESREYCL
jgi:hypothetical protein